MKPRTITRLLTIALSMAVTATIGACGDSQPAASDYPRRPSDQERRADLRRLLDTLEPAPPGRLTVAVVTQSRLAESGLSAPAMGWRVDEFQWTIKAAEANRELVLMMFPPGGGAPFVGSDLDRHTAVYFGAPGSMAEERLTSVRITSLDTTAWTMSGSVACELAYCVHYTGIISYSRCEDPFIVTISFTDIPIRRRPEMSATIQNDSSGRSWDCTGGPPSQYTVAGPPEVEMIAQLKSVTTPSRFSLLIGFFGPVRIGSHHLTQGTLMVAEDSSGAWSRQQGAVNEFNRIVITSIDSVRHTYCGTFQMRLDRDSGAAYTIRNGVFREYPLR